MMKAREQGNAPKMNKYDYSNWVDQQPLSCLSADAQRRLSFRRLAADIIKTLTEDTEQCHAALFSLNKAPRVSEAAGGIAARCRKLCCDNTPV